jgi:predicted amidohydrolase YtcJ
VNIRALGVFLLAATAVHAQAQTALPKGDVIYVHGNIYTGVPGTSAFHEVQRAEAMAVKGDRIVAIGKTDDVLKYKGPQTQVVDLGGRFTMPGFNDAHVHLASGGFRQLEVDLTGAKSLEEFRQRIRVFVEKSAPGAWITGSGWDHTLWPVKELPSRWDLDEITGDHPAFFVRIDGHIAVANTRALKLASITIASRNPEGGKVDRFETGEPTGILRETAQEVVRAVMPKPDHDSRRRALEFALQDAAEHGITSAQDNSAWDDFRIYEELEKEGKLTLRITEWLPLDDPLETLEAHRKAHPRDDLMLHTGLLKGFMDGSLGSRTAALLAPYADDPKNSGLPQYEQEKLNALVTERVLAGFQIGLHAIGDRGVDMALTAFGAAEKVATEKLPKDRKPDFRLRIEHAQVLAPPQFARFRDLKVIASMQPNHVLTDMNWAQARLGDARAAHSYPWQEFLHSGVRLAFGTDYPVEPITPFRGLYAAITRRSEDGKREYFPAQRLTMDEALAAYTQAAAYAEFAEKDKGRLAPGLLADFVVLDRDLTSVPAPQVLQTRVLRTVVGGRTVFEQK